jgi:hypothetical protein
MEWDWNAETQWLQERLPLSEGFVEMDRVILLRWILPPAVESLIRW